MADISDPTCAEAYRRCRDVHGPLRAKAEKIVRQLEREHGLVLSNQATNRLADLVYEALPEQERPTERD